ncbi:hypothetical protein QUB68_15065 [Microcoleus sp. A006_D1]|uniref:hypothetical protein n=1 Tax=Microcoleus sp. A006_D1 TaxID=3055267 RepID=UPI002FD31789
MTARQGDSTLAAPDEGRSPTTPNCPQRSHLSYLGVLPPMPDIFPKYRSHTENPLLRPLPNQYLLQNLFYLSAIAQLAKIDVSLADQTLAPLPNLINLNATIQ